jgi:hypothetical protein
VGAALFALLDIVVGAALFGLLGIVAVLRSPDVRRLIFRIFAASSVSSAR